MVSILWIHPEGRAGPEAAARFSPCEVRTAPGAAEAIEALRVSPADALWVSLPLADCPPLALLEEVLRIDAGLPVVFEVPSADLTLAVTLLKAGAFHVVERGVDFSAIGADLIEAVSLRRRTGVPPASEADEPWRNFLIGNSRAMREIAQVIRLVGRRRSTVLLTGETGTGKELVARALHLASGRSHLPMVAVNCGALPEHLLESELFGHVKGAYTGAVQTRIGRFEQAHRSTLFLDEIGDMPVDLQVKLLRVLQEKELQRLGSSETIRIDTRVVAATNGDLLERIRQGKFREDLYYRLNVVPVTLPPLRERMADLPLLVSHFLDKVAEQEDLPRKQVLPEALRRLAQYSWPGNVRELENRVEMAVMLSGDRATLYPADFNLPRGEGWKPPAMASRSMPVIAVPDDGLDFEQTVGRIERTILEQALEKARGNKRRAAALLGLKRTTLAAKLKSLEAAAAAW